MAADVVATLRQGQSARAAQVREGDNVPVVSELGEVVVEVCDDETKLAVATVERGEDLVNGEERPKASSGDGAEDLQCNDEGRHEELMRN
ncbi:hypothetical protein E2562_016769 [Oryza meyeriana var. granulata]|uniref:Uncharacterized protein n=1 Tax=Oryza meyeriana var. granulata TaxID=110450 RepID=A0A6G1BL94_9ORYZ|nr:hypothetical protein E2562_016769 [Oryza meyeriana var. granulata]